MPYLTVFFIVSFCAQGSFSDVPSDNNVEIFRSNRTSRVLGPSHSSTDRMLYKSAGYYEREPEQYSYPDGVPKAKADNPEPPKTPRGFHEFVSGDQDSYPENVDDQNRRWSPYYLPPLVQDNMHDSPSSPEWNVWKREDDRQNNKKSDYPYPKFSPEYTDMIMMMQTMKKMDSNSKQSILSRILDNPTTLVMATFIPISLLLAAALPVIVNVMMNGISIPAFATTATGSKARAWEGGNSTDFLRPILESLADFSTRYLDSQDCLQRIFCEMTKENTTSVTNIPGARYLKQAANAATVIVNDNLLHSVGVKTLVQAIKSGKCEDIACDKQSRKLSPSLLNVINDAIYSYTFKTKSKAR